MNAQIWTTWWWEVAVAVLAANSIVFGVLAVGNDHTDWAIASGFGPAELLVIGLALRDRWRVGATAILIVASLAAATWFWMVYPAVLASIVIIGGLNSGNIGPTRPRTHATAKRVIASPCDERVLSTCRCREATPAERGRGWALLENGGV